MSAEAAGVPSVAVITEVFKGMAAIEAAGLGIPDMRVAVLPHPVGPLAADEIEAAVRSRFEEIERALGLAGVQTP